ncbi:MAG: DUF4328 domain-containing protein [Chloroflexi bacterium]|nr:DUF4328 domain-containing protein [Chloroflexota bacterium]
MPRRNPSSNPNSNQGRDPRRPIPRRGAGRGGGRDRTPRTRGRGIGYLNPFDVGGRQRVGRSLREQEEQPYRYDSNGRQILIIKIVLALWIILAIASALAEFNERRVLDRWADRGFIEAPADKSVNGLLDYAAEQGIPCTPDSQDGSLPEPCDRLFDFAHDLTGAQDLVFGFFSGFLFLFVVISVMVASFAYQANRNLLTLKTEGQKFSATGAMLWLFVPLFNFFKGAQIFGEIWRGSDPEGNTSGGEEWKSRSSKWWIDVWWFTLALVIMLNILFRTQFSSNEIDARLTLAWLIIVSDIFMIVPAVLALKSMTAIHEMQEKRHEIVGPHLAVPPVKGLKL